MTATQVVVFPDVEAAVIDYLKANLSLLGGSTAVSNTVPKPRPSRLVRVNRTGGIRLDAVREQPQISVDCWDAKLQDAHDLAQVVRGLIWVMPTRSTQLKAYRVADLGGIQNDPDPDTAFPRYTFTSTLDVRGNALT